MDNPEAHHMTERHDVGDAQVSPKPIEPTPRPSDESEYVHGQREPGSIGALSIKFMDNVNKTFGENSAEWKIIYQALTGFKIGRSSKRDAHASMVEVLGDNEELKQGLESVLYHQDALWGPEDFYQPPLSIATTPASAHTSPAFLQPQHEPQMRIPPMSTLWDPSQYELRQYPSPHSINPALLRSNIPQHDTQPTVPTIQHQDPREILSSGHGDYGEYRDYNSYEHRGPYHRAFAHNTYRDWNPFTPNGPSSPAPPLPSTIPLPNQHTSPPIGHAQSFATYSNHGYDAGSASPVRHAVEQHCRSIPIHKDWEADDPRLVWEPTNSHHLSQPIRAPDGYRQAHSPATPSNECTQQSALFLGTSHHTLPYFGPPTAARIDHSALNRYSLSSSASRTDSTALLDTYLQLGNETASQDHVDSPSLAAVPSQPAQPEGDQLESGLYKARRPAGSGPYIHGLCGKGFMSRASVKKHHWGSKAESTTGCWAKHNRPNREWDEHPSCKQDAPRAAVKKQTRPAKRKEKAVSTKFKAAVAPSMVPNPENTIPGFPTLEDLPNTVAEVVQSTPTFAAESLSYHLAHNPTHSKLDTLLTAVNVASKIDAPTPQGRNDSVVSNLDAQVAAAEHDRQGFVPWSNRQKLELSIPRNQLLTHAQDLPVGLGISETETGQVPTSMVIPSQHQEAIEDDVRVAGTSFKAEVPASAIGVDVEMCAQTTPSVTADAREPDKKSHRRPARRSGISKREQKILGLSLSPEPEMK